MTKKGDIITLSDKDFDRIFDIECKKVLGISGKEYLERRNNGGLPKSTAIHDVEMLLKLVRK
jgi:hypothetical protein